MIGRWCESLGIRRMNERKGTRMATSDDLIRIAGNYVGYKAGADPEAGSLPARWYYLNVYDDDPNYEWILGPSDSVWWCCMFVSMCLSESGVQCAGFPSINTDYSVSHSEGSHVSVGDIQRGDIVIFDWNWDGCTDHVGIVESADISDGSLHTIEGNYYNAVALVDRSDSINLISCVIRPYYSDTSLRNMTSINNYPDAVKHLQTYLSGDPKYYGGLIDGVIDSPASMTINAMQKWLHDNGYYNGICDGVLDTPTDTVKALQLYLEDHCGYDGMIDGIIDEADSLTMACVMKLS